MNKSHLFRSLQLKKFAYIKYMSYLCIVIKKRNNNKNLKRYGNNRNHK